LQTVERRTIRKISWRLLPLIVIIYFVAYIDRTNVSFAALTMNKDLGLSPYVFGWGAGIFFLGYFLFEVPSNVILEKVGARIWIARIMITRGLVSGAMAFASGPASFLTLRFLLGVAEAGFFPGVILYFTYWFPKSYRARVISMLFIACPARMRSLQLSRVQFSRWMDYSDSLVGNGCSSLRPFPPCFSLLLFWRC
jgi:MFS transporter, ACS family, tartrate transporter